jgi:hypothetical protein
MPVGRGIAGSRSSAVTGGVMSLTLPTKNPPDGGHRAGSLGLDAALGGNAAVRVLTRIRSRENMELTALN